MFSDYTASTCTPKASILHFPSSGCLGHWSDTAFFFAVKVPLHVWELWRVSGACPTASLLSHVGKYQKGEESVPTLPAKGSRAGVPAPTPHLRPSSASQPSLSIPALTPRVSQPSLLVPALTPHPGPHSATPPSVRVPALTCIHVLSDQHCLPLDEALLPLPLLFCCKMNLTETVLWIG